MCPRCTHHDFNSTVVVFEHFVSVRFVVHTVRVVVDCMTTKTDSRSTVVLYGIEAKYVAAAASVKACSRMASRRVVFSGELWTMRHRDRGMWQQKCPAEMCAASCLRCVDVHTVKSNTRARIVQS